MSSMKSSPSACLIGDLVGSRSHPDRRDLHRRLAQVLADVDAAVPAITPLRVIAGDEYQGRYDSLGAALAAAYRIQARLWPEVSVRHGVGWGEVRLLDDEGARGVMDGPGWWAARAAIETVDRLEQRPGLATVRTSVAVAEPDGSGGSGGASTFTVPPAIEAALRCRDHLLGSLSERSRVLLAGLAEGRTQAEMGERLGISASAVSQRVRRDGLTVLQEAQSMLEEL